VLGGVSDISRRRALERARDEMLSTVSHDLRAPLITIGIAADALAQGGERDSESTREVAGLIQRSVKWMDRMIRDLLDVASIQAGHLPLAEADEAPAPLLARTVEMFAAAARERGVALQTRVAPGVPAVRGDADRLLQALGNLVANALAFTDRGGQITLRADHDMEGVRFAVEDTGTGISGEDLPHVFDRTWQKGRRRRDGGTGLGLAIVRGIVEAHGGTVDVASTLGEGSRFSFTIPSAS
jgi:signal transduction histidine kinase